MLGAYRRVILSSSSCIVEYEKDPLARELSSSTINLSQLCPPSKLPASVNADHDFESSLYANSTLEYGTVIKST